MAVCRQCKKVLTLEREATGTCGVACRCKLWRDEKLTRDIHKGKVSNLKVSTIEKLGFKVFIIETK